MPASKPQERLANHKIRSVMVALGVVVILVATGFGAGARPSSSSGGTTEANITRVTTSLLERSQFAHHVLDDSLARRLLGRYVDALDPTRSLLLQSDVDELVAADAMLARTTRENGDTRVAGAIFARFLERLGQRTAYATNALHGTFDFTKHDAYAFDREHAARPRDLAAAQQLWQQQLRADYLQEKLADPPPADIASTLSRRYERQLNTMKALTSDQVLDVYLNALAHVYDPHSDYLDHEEMESFSIAMSLSLFGIGATLEATDGACTIRELVPGGPAARSGALKPGDRIVAVAQASKDAVDISNMPLPQAVELIRGARGSTVTLKILPAGAAEGAPTTTVAIVRDQVKLEDQEAKARIVDLGGKLRLGVIELPSFYAGDDDGAHRSATEDVARLLRKLETEHVRGIVLDVRHNGGGSLAEAISLTGLFIRTGPVVQTRDQSGHIEVGTDTDPSVLYDGPLVVLTSRFSASATEILAGALQDYGRAVIVGDSSTFGKGTVQTVLPLARIMDHLGLAHGYDPGALKVTISKFYRPSGASTQLRGVASDIVLPSLSEVSGVSEASLKDPLPWDTIPSATYEHQDRVAPYVSELRARMKRRIATDKDFAYLTSDVARFAHRLATKSLSLDEAERRAELSEDKARDAERPHPAQPTTYAITLENASSPGLPAPKQDHAPTTTTAKNHGWSPDDVLLSESERILADYIQLLHANLASLKCCGNVGAGSSSHGVLHVTQNRSPSAPHSIDDDSLPVPAATAPAGR